MAGMTESGFVPKTLSEIQQDITAKCVEIIDPVTGEAPFTNVEDDSVLQQVIGIIASELSVCWNAAFAAYAQFDPLKNTGAGQSGTVQLNGIVRSYGAPDIIEVQLVGRPTTFVQEGVVYYGTLDGALSFVQMETVILPESSSPTVTILTKAKCTTNGANNLAAGAVSVIQTDVPGLFSVSNTQTLTNGTSQESDAHLRIRQQRSTANTSYRQVEAIYSAIAAVDGVIYTRVYQNADTYPQDARGIPFKEFAAVVEGGDDTEIADAIFLRMPLGLLGYGSTHVTRTDRQGMEYAIGFSRPISVDIYVQLTIRITQSALVPDDYATKIAGSIVDFAQYGSGDDSGFPPGADVIRTRLYTPINQIAGFEIVSLSLKGGSVADFAEVNIPIAWNEVARFDTSRITVNTVSA